MGRGLSRVLDLHAPASQRWATSVVLVLLGLLSVAVRVSLVGFQNADYHLFSAWYDFARSHGIGSLRYGASNGFSNYNPPYSYFLYLLTLLPLPKIVALKGLVGLFDVVLAGSVFLLVRVFSRRAVVPIAAGLVIMFLPTVLVTGVLWGQFDQLYTAFLLLSLWAALTGRGRWAWVFFGVAVSIKLQAIFFLPVLGVLSFRRIRWWDAIWGVASFAVLTFPPVLAGRSVGSLLSIYPDQAKLFQGRLTLDAPNPYQWVSNRMYPYLNGAGIFLALAACLFILLISVLEQKFSPAESVLISALVLYVVPFLLPAMHERYFFPAGIAVVVLAVVRPTVSHVGLAVLGQAVTLLSYCPFLFRTTPVPLGVLALGNLIIIWVLAAVFLGAGSADVREGGVEPPRPKAPDPKSGVAAVTPLPREGRV